LPPQFRADALFLTDKENSGAQVARSLDCAFYFYGGGVVPTHCVNGYGGEHWERVSIRASLHRRGELQFFVDYSAPVIKPATCADAMRQPHRSAVRAGDQSRGLQRVVGASLAAA